MPFSFTEIEQRKTHTIGTMFVFLFASYVVFIVGLFWAVKIAAIIGFALETSDSYSPYRYLPAHSMTGGLSALEVGWALGIGLLAAVLHWSFVSYDMVGKVLRAVGARPLIADIPQEKMVLNIISEVEVAVGGKTPVSGVIIPTKTLNAFAVSDLAGFHVIGVTEGLVKTLSRPQLEAVIGHEAAHIFSQDSLLSTVAATMFGLFSAINEGAQNVIRGLFTNFDDDTSFHARRRVRMPAVVFLVSLAVFIVSFYAKLANMLMAMFISRQKEFRADAISVRLTRDPQSLAEALYLVGLHSHDIPKAGNLDAIFIVSPRYFRLDEESGFWSDLWATHPPLKDRLKVLLDMAHGDFDSLVEKYRNKTGDAEAKTLAPAPASLPEPQWLVYGENQWQGPFNVAQLAALAWLKPDTLVQRRDGNDIVRLTSDTHLQGVLSRGQLQNLSQFCPHCDVPLKSYLYEGVPIQSCPQCAGILAKEKDVQWILDHNEVCFTTKVAQLAQELQTRPVPKDAMPTDIYRTDGLICPQCRHAKARMTRKFFDRVHPVEVDKCLFCGKVWFDRSELEVLQYILEAVQQNPPAKKATGQ